MEVDILIGIDVKINPKIPPTTLEEIHINQAEVYIRAKLHKLSKQLEEELQKRWDMNNFGVSLK
jgi:hypothetical protein